MTKFTKEEISLCKQVAEKYRKDIKKGDWFLLPGENFVKDAKELFARKGIQFIEIDGRGHTLDLYTQSHPLSSDTQLKDFGYIPIPLWTISDCLEFLRGRCKDHVLLIHEEDLDDDEEWYLWFDEYKETQQWDKGKTPLEACLKVVLAVLEEEG